MSPVIDGGSKIVCRYLRMRGLLRLIIFFFLAMRFLLLRAAGFVLRDAFFLRAILFSLNLGPIAKP